MSKRARERANARPWNQPTDDDQQTGDASDGCGDGDESEDDEQ